ncbi:MAG: Fic family protein [Bryobacteraceae bacterium]|jgi:Fic family protein
MLFEAPKLDGLEIDVIGRIDDLKQTLRYSVQTPKRWPGLLRRALFARAIRASNSIEGFNVTVEDAIAAVEGDDPLDAADADWKAVRGYRSAMTYVLQLAADPHFKHSTDFLRSLHFMMMEYDLSKNPGRWRPGPIQVVDEAKKEVVYKAPDAQLVPGLMAQLVAALNQPDNSSASMVRAAMGHLNFVMIHPFSDGNGRMARCLQSLILARAGTLAPEFSSIEEYLGRNTREYYDVLLNVGAGNWSPRRDARPWVRFCLTAHFRQATTILRRSREVQQTWDALEVEVKKRKLPERTILALSDAASGLRVRNAAYRSVAGISVQVATKDLKLLVDRGLLVSSGEKKWRSYEASEVLKELRSRFTEPKRVPDPFTVRRGRE